MTPGSGATASMCRKPNGIGTRWGRPFRPTCAGDTAFCKPVWCCRSMDRTARVPRAPFPCALRWRRWSKSRALRLPRRPGRSIGDRRRKEPLGAVCRDDQGTARAAQPDRPHPKTHVAIVADGSFCNRTVLAQDWEKLNVSVTARGRKDIVLCKRAPGKGRRFYGKTKFTPEEVRRRDSMAPVAHGPDLSRRMLSAGALQRVNAESIGKAGPANGLCACWWWRRWVIAPAKTGASSTGKPAYLLTTDLTTPAALLLQDYFDRWGIEVNHRDEKEILGVGEAQVWNEPLGQQSAGAAGGHV